MTSYFDFTNSVFSVTMTTIRHCSILEFERRQSNQAVAPGITRPLHANGYKFAMSDFSHIVMWVDIFERSLRNFNLRFLKHFERYSDVEGVLTCIHVKKLTKSFIHWFWRATFCYEPRTCRKNRAGKSRVSFTLVQWCHSQVFFFISSSVYSFLWLSSVFMNELNVIICTILCSCNCNWDHLI